MNLPTKITFTRIFATVAIFIALFVLYLIKVFNPSFATPYLEIANVKVDWIFIILLVIFILVSLTDMLDGRLARSRNEVTTFGKFLDPIADKLLVNSFCLFLIAPQVFASYNQAQTVGIALWCAILMVARDIVVDALRFIAASKNVVISASAEGILVSDMEQSSYIKPFVDKFEQQVMFAEKSWGNFKVLDVEDMIAIYKMANA